MSKNKRQMNHKKAPQNDAFFYHPKNTLMQLVRLHFLKQFCDGIAMIRYLLLIIIEIIIIIMSF